jgi:hypothetical protein
MNSAGRTTLMAALFATMAFAFWATPLPATAPVRSTPTTIPPKIDSTASDIAEFLSRSSKLKEDDVDGRLSLARWAHGREMYDQAVEMANQALYRDPNSRAAYTILQQVDDARPLPPEPDAETALKEEMRVRFKRDFKTRTSKHFMLVYDTTDTFAAQRAATMERVYDAFRFYFNMNTLRPAFLTKRLPVLLLKDREDYLLYGKQTENTDLSWSAGYYTQRSNRSVFYDDASGASAASFARQTNALKAQIEDFNKQIATARGQGQIGMVNNLLVQRNRVSESLNQVNNRMGTQVAAQNNSKTMHEAAHQVAFNLGIQKRSVDYPLWFSEGLACSFEFEDAQGRRGPALLNTGRVSIIKEALKNDTLIPLEKFLAVDLTDMSDEAAMHVTYAQGWALFHYLYKFHRQGNED